MFINHCKNEHYYMKRRGLNLRNRGESTAQSGQNTAKSEKSNDLFIFVNSNKTTLK